MGDVGATIPNIRNGLLARRAPAQQRATPEQQRAADSLVAELAVDAQARALAEGVVYTEFGPGHVIGRRSPGRCGVVGGAAS